MEIHFKTPRLAKDCNDDKRLSKKHGADQARKIRQRLDDLTAAVTLHEMRSLPGNCHELSGDRADQLAVNLKDGLRLVFVPADDPIPRREDSGLDWKLITAICVVEITDYHG